MKRLILSLAIICLAFLPSAGCKPATAAATPPAPLLQGANSTFDQDSYKTLIGFQAAINDLNKSYNANPAALASLKPALDQAANDYNLANLAWKTYHQSATAANQAAVSSALTKVQSDVTSAQKAVKP